MSYDLMNRRDHFTKHHTSVADSDDTIRAYLDIGAPPKKMNLGFAYYAKYFTTQSDCGSNPLNCPIVPAEDSVTGKDKLTSGAWTFEKSHMAPVDTSRLAVSYDGTCGADKGTKCATSCCSQYGNCGTSPEHCNGACQHAFGIGCTDPDVAGSWQKAAKNGVTDEKAGAQYYFDPLNRLFWTWDTPALITRKFEQIVDKHGLGGVMAWSLGEDSYDWSHIRQMASELKKRSSGPQSAPGPKPKPSYTDRPTPPSQKSDLPGPPAQNPGRPGPPSPRPGYSAPKPQPAPPSHDDYDNHPAVVSDPSLPYDVVWVDGTPDGPTNDNPTAPGSPADYSVPYPAKPASYETSPPPPPPPPPAQYTPHHEHEHVGKYPGTTETPPGYMQYENQGSACSVKTSKRGTHAVRRVKKARV
jgi:chitinase